MPEKSKMHFLRISGIVKRIKKYEFENTVKFVFRLFTDDCIEHSLAAEIQSKNAYYFYTSWKSEAALKKFMESEEYQLVRGAYDALGVLEKIEFGYDVEINTIRINYLYMDRPFS
jgi:hypothetical protein